MKVKIEKLIDGGKGLALHEGKRIFVSYAAPGDVLEVEVTKEHESYSEAKIINIIETSPERVEPKCPAFAKCGGCQWQHLSYETQLFWKREIVKEDLQRLGRVDAALAEEKVLKPIASPNKWNYRNRIQLNVRNNRVGFCRPESLEVVEFTECHIAEPLINEQLKERREELRMRNRGISLRSYPELD